MIKLLLTFIFFSHPNISTASLDNVKNMTQVSPGGWEVNCNNDKMEKASTRQINANEVCVQKEEQSMCVQTAQKLLPTREYDDKEEMDELVTYCEHGTDYTYKCLESMVSMVKKSKRDERQEIIQVIKACQDSSAAVEKCINFVKNKTLKIKDDFNIHLGIAQTCSASKPASLLCMKTASQGLRRNEFDDLNEVLELVRACEKSKLEIDTCIEETRTNLNNNLLYDQRHEVIKIINECL